MDDLRVNLIMDVNYFLFVFGYIIGWQIMIDYLAACIKKPVNI